MRKAALNSYMNMINFSEYSTFNNCNK